MSRSKWLMLGAGAVAIVRYIGVFLHAEGGAVHGWLWDVVNGASGAGMAVLEAVGIWHTFEAWAAAQPGRMRDTLMGLIVAMFASLALMVTPYVFAASQQAKTAVTLVTLSGAALWVWSFAVTVAPLLVMAAAGLADTLMRASTSAQEAQYRADNVELVSQSVHGAVDALKSEFQPIAEIAQQAMELAQRAATVAEQSSAAITESRNEIREALRAVAHDSELLHREVTEVRNTITALPQPAVMPTQNTSVDERAAQYLLQNPTASSEQVAQHLNVSAARVRALAAWRNRQPA